MQTLNQGQLRPNFENCVRPTYGSVTKKRDIQKFLRKKCDFEKIVRKTLETITQKLRKNVR